MKFALFGNTYQAKKSAHVERLLSILSQHNAEVSHLPGVLRVSDGRPQDKHPSRRCFRWK